MTVWAKNPYKGTQTDALDPETGDPTPLFNPREQRWSEHFAWTDGGVRIQGLTSTGRATVAALRLNNPYIVPARRVGFGSWRGGIRQRSVSETCRRS